MCAISLDRYIGTGSHSHVYVLVIYRNRFNLIPTVVNNGKEFISLLHFFILAPSSSFEDRIVQRCTWAFMSWQLENVAPDRDTLDQHPGLLTGRKTRTIF